MVQLFGDQLRDDGPTRTWLTAMGDIPRSAVSEHLRRNRVVAHSMASAPTPVSRLLGLLGVAGGLVLLAAFLFDIETGLNFGRIFLFLVGAMAVILAIHRSQAKASPAFALAGAVPALFANVALLVMELFVMGRQAPAFGGTFGWVFFWVSLATWLSVAWFGAVTLCIGRVSRISALVLVIGSLLSLLGLDRLGLVVPGEQNVYTTLALSGIFLTGVAWVLLGLEVAFRRRPSAPSGV